MAKKVAAVCVLLLGLGACSSPKAASNGSARGSAAASLSSEVLRTPLSDLAGKPVVIADALQGDKKVALVFWQAWCAPCRAEAPGLVAASRKYPNLVVIGVVSGPDEAVDAKLLERTIDELDLPYQNVRDRALDLTRSLDVRGTPTIVVLGAQGQILYRGHESPDWNAVL